MTRKESHALLKEMRETGCVVRLKCEGRTHKAKVMNDVVRVVGYGFWACKNTFSDFYEEVRDCILVEKYESDYNIWNAD